MSTSKSAPLSLRFEARGTRTAIGISILVCQLAMIAYARFVPSRYFCWAPLDSDNEFAIAVSIHNRTFSAREVRQRYRLPEHGHDGRSIQHIKDIISQYEQTYGRAEGANVTLTYRVNGGKPQQWIWPPQ
jgi:hypothetical protein